MVSESCRFRVGNLECFAVSDGVFPHATPAFLFGPGAPAGMEGEMPIPLNFLAVRAGDQVTLIDTGYGSLAASRTAPAGKLLDGLLSLGLRPDDVGTVILTHAHADHFGGIPLYPKARFVVSATDAAALPPEIRGAIAGRERLVEGPAEVFPYLRVLPAPGHTPGNLFVELESAGESLLHVVDVCLHPLHLEHPEWSPAHEADRAGAAALRRRTLEGAAASGRLLFACHLPFPGLGRVVRTRDGLCWQALYN